MGTKKHCFNTMLLAGLLALSAVAGLTACSEDDSIIDDINYTIIESPKALKYIQFTRDGNDLHCVYYWHSLGYNSELRVDCQRKDSVYTIDFHNVVIDPNALNPHMTRYVKVFFTLRDVKEDLFYVNIPSYNNAYFPVDMRGHHSVKVDFTIGEPIYYYDEDE